MYNLFSVFATNIFFFFTILLMHLQCSLCKFPVFNFSGGCWCRRGKVIFFFHSFLIYFYIKISITFPSLDLTWGSRHHTRNCSGTLEFKVRLFLIFFYRKNDDYKDTVIPAGKTHEVCMFCWRINLLMKKSRSMLTFKKWWQFGI